jgi:hypothetical protein
VHFASGAIVSPGRSDCAAAALAGVWLAAGTAETAVFKPVSWAIASEVEVNSKTGSQRPITMPPGNPSNPNRLHPCSSARIDEKGILAVTVMMEDGT